MINIFRRSLLVRILVYQLIIGMVPLLFFGVISIFSMNNVLKTEAIEFQKENVNQGTLYIDLMMDDVESLIANLSGLDDINDVLSSQKSETTYEKLSNSGEDRLYIIRLH